VESAETLQPSLVGGFGPSIGRVPALQVVQDHAEPPQGVEVHVGGIPIGIFDAADEGGNVEHVHVVLLTRLPQRGVRQQVDPQVGYGVPQRAADPRGIVVLVDEEGEGAEGAIIPALTIRPDPPECQVGLARDLLRCPLAQIDGVAGDHLFAVADLVAVVPVIGDQGLGVVQFEHGAPERFLRPGRLAQKAHGGLVAVQGRSQSYFFENGPRPGQRVAVFAGGLQGIEDSIAGGFELLIVDQTFDFLPVPVVLATVNAPGQTAGRIGRSPADKQNARNDQDDMDAANGPHDSLPVRVCLGERRTNGLTGRFKEPLIYTARCLN